MPIVEISIAREDRNEEKEGRERKRKKGRESEERDTTGGRKESREDLAYVIGLLRLRQIREGRMKSVDADRASTTKKTFFRA